MGGCCSGQQQSSGLTVLVLGLDNAGKTTLTQTIRGELNPVIVPTIGFSKPVKQHVSGYDMTFYDLGGGPRIRDVWQQYFHDVHGVIYVVDSSNPDRLQESKQELDKVLNDPQVLGKPVVVFGNKQDVAGSMDEAQISLGLGLNEITLCRHHVVMTVARPSSNGGAVDDRIWDGIHWLCDAVSSDLDHLNSRIAADRTAFESKIAAERQERLARIEQRQREQKQDAAGSDKDAEKFTAKPAPEPKPHQDVLLCDVCKKEPAVRKCAAAKWAPVCEPCGQAAESAANPPEPAPTATDTTSTSPPAETPTAAAAPAPVSADTQVDAQASESRLAKRGSKNRIVPL